MYKVCFLLLSITALATSQTTDGCQAVTNEPNFYGFSFVGSWYEIESFEKRANGDPVKNCTTYTFQPYNETTSIIDSFCNLDGALTPLHGTGYATSTSGRYNIQFEGMDSREYNIIYTDYDTYTCIYSCQVEDDGSITEGAWVLSRTAHLDIQDLSDAEDLFREFGIDTTKFETTGQGEYCTYIFPPTATSSASTTPTTPQSSTTEDEMSSP